MRIHEWTTRLCILPQVVGDKTLVRQYSEDDEDDAMSWKVPNLSLYPCTALFSFSFIVRF